MENLRELIRDIDKHMRAEWYAGRLPAETWPKSLSDRLAAVVAEKPWPMYDGSAGAIRAVDPDDLKAAPVSVPDEREAFEAKFKHLDLSRDRDAWMQEKYKHAAISLAWEAWQGRAALAATPAQDVNWDAELGLTAMRFVDRAGDVHPGIDDAETICADFYSAMLSVIDPMPHLQRMKTDAAMRKSAAAPAEGRDDAES